MIYVVVSYIQINILESVARLQSTIIASFHDNHITMNEKLDCETPFCHI